MSAEGSSQPSKTGLPLTELAWDTVLASLTYLGAADLSASSEASRLLFLLVCQAQRRPSLVTEVGLPSNVLAALGQRLSATPTLGFLFSTGPLEDEGISKILCKRLPATCNLIGAETNELQALVKAGSTSGATDSPSSQNSTAAAVPSSTELRNVRQQGHVAVMLGSFPDAVSRSFFLSPEMGRDLCECSSDADAVELCRKQDLPSGDEWKTIVLIVGASHQYESSPERLLHILQKACPNAAVLGGVAGGSILLHSRGHSHVKPSGVVGLALKGNVPLTALVSRGAKPLTSSLQTSGAMVEHGNLVIPRVRFGDTAGAEIPPIEMVIQAQRNSNRQVPMFVGVRYHSSGGYKLENCTQDLFDQGGAMRLEYDGFADEGHSLSDCQVRMYQLDADECRSDLKRLLGYVSQTAVDEEEEVLGSVMFTCGGRSTRFYNESNVDMKQFQQTFPMLPLIGFWAGGEIGPQAFAEATPCEATRTGNAAFQGFTAVMGIFRAPKATASNLQVLSMSDEQLPGATGEVFAGLTAAAKERGNSAFKEGKFSEATEHYGRATALAGVPSAELSPKDKAIIFSNSAMARIKVDDFSSALVDAESAISLDPLNVKAHYRLGQALIGLKRSAEAAAGLKEANSQFDAQESSLTKLLAQAEMMAERQAKRTKETDAA